MHPEDPAPADIDALVREIERLPASWHGAGTVGGRLLRALARHAGGRPLRHSLETGAGRTTLLLSHLSDLHEVFAVDAGGSVAAARTSPLLRQGHVRFVEGPTQRTLPAHSFDDKVDLAFLDGPHGYPFPELEYWHVYPHLREGSLLVIDDIHIPTVNHLFRFLREDAMFRLIEIAEKTAFFERTAVPAFDPLGDGWELQRFNARRFPILAGLPLLERLKLLVPAPAARRLRALLGR